MNSTASSAPSSADTPAEVLGSEPAPTKMLGSVDVPPEAKLWAFDHKVAIEHITKNDARLARLIAKCVEFRLNIEPAQSPYEALLEAIVYQSISGKAAATIFARIAALGANGRCPTPQEILKLRKSVLRKAGLSFAKIAAAKDLAQKTIEGIVPTLADAEKMSDEELVERLISVRGIGAWTVEMFLIFRLGRPDVLPIHDYGVQKGFALTYGKKAIPKPRELAAFGERWRPYRTVASWYMWRAVQLAGKDARKISKNPAKRSPRKNANARRSLK
ncbi:MAG TPA: DNA-3-methyladenine glycosylase [Candidatus Acidoferrales bacterium]|nr:DNA-3-methyladenine glycosylase [Candidatus Acidoferrales bacterium]